MKRLLLALAALSLAAGCGEPTAPPVATSVTLSTTSLSFDAIGATQAVTASVTDQRGEAMPGEAVSFTADGAIVSITVAEDAAGTRTATVRSLANGVPPSLPRPARPRDR